jgi:NAD/NADP transhydrogenase beta subunit
MLVLSSIQTLAGMLIQKAKTKTFMTKSGKSVFYFGIYVVLMGVLVCLVPAELISILKLPEIPTAWAIFMGLLVIVIGCYDIICGRNNLKPLIKGSIYLRLFFFTGIFVLFISGQMPKEIILLGVIDLLGAVWTIFSLKAETKTS